MLFTFFFCKLCLARCRVYRKKGNVLLVLTIVADVVVGVIGVGVVVVAAAVVPVGIVVVVGPTLSHDRSLACRHHRQAGKQTINNQSASQEDVQFHETYCTKMKKETQHGNIHIVVTSCFVFLSDT